MPEPIDVVIVTFNSGHVIAGLLDSLPQAMDGLPYRTVVVDNGSSDDTVRLLRNRAEVHVIESTNRGYAAGINLGTAALRGTGPILVLNPDVRLSPRSVRPLVRAISGTPGIGIAAPRVLDPDGSLFLSLRREPTLARALGLGRTGHRCLSERVDDRNEYDREQFVDWALGATLLVSRECFEVLHGWDETFFLYSEETDFCLRARDAGLRTLYVPSSVVTHIGGQSGQSPRIHAMQVINRVRFYRRRHRTLASWAYFLATLASETSWLLRGRARSGTALAGLLFPWRRPEELGCSHRFMPR